MARHYKRRSDSIDPERGDDHYFTREKMAIVRSLPRNTRNAALIALFDWLCGGDEPSISDPENAESTAMSFACGWIADQKTRVRQYRDTCDKKSVKRPKKKYKKSRGNMGQHMLPRGNYNNTNTEFSKKESLRDTSFLENAVDRRVAGACAESAPASADNLERHDVPQEEKNETSYAILDALGLLEEED